LKFREAWSPEDDDFCIPRFGYRVGLVTFLISLCLKKSNSRKLDAPNMIVKEDSDRFRCRNFYYNVSHLLSKSTYARIGKIFEFGGLDVKTNEHLKDEKLYGKNIYVVPMSDCEFIWLPEDVYWALYDLQYGPESSSSSVNEQESSSSNVDEQESSSSSVDDIMEEQSDNKRKREEQEYYSSDMQVLPDWGEDEISKSDIKDFMMYQYKFLENWLKQNK
jgi:hypothetical protein